LNRKSDEAPKRPAYEYDVGAFLRSVVRRKMPALDEKAIGKLTATLQSLRDLGWSFEDVTAWVKYETVRICGDPTIKSPVGVLVRRLETGSPKDLPRPPQRPSPDGISPDRDYAEKVRDLRDIPPQVSMQVIKLIGDRTGDYHAAYVTAQAEFEKQGAPHAWEMDIGPLSLEGPDVDDFVAWQNRTKTEKEQSK
jgi:hypothetical protein